MDEMSYYLAQQEVIDRTRDARRHHERFAGVSLPRRRRTSGWLRHRSGPPDDPN